MNLPAIEGGPPVRKNFLVFGKPRITKKEINEVLATIKSGWLGTGPKTHKFEQEFQQYAEAKHAIALNSCTAGLHLALDVLGIKSGDEVITTPLTFTSTVNVILHHGAKPVFCDVDPHTWNIDPTQVEKKINRRTKAIISVDLHGRPCDYQSLIRLAKRHALFLVEDAAHAAESVYKGKKIGSIADFTAFSFYVTKNIMTGEGGMLTTNDDKWAYEAKIRSLHGISKDAWKRYSNEGFTPYETLYPGYKYNMMDLVASFGIHQLHDVEINHKKRTAYWQLYDRAFRELPQLSTPAPEEKDTIHARHLYALVLRPEMMTIDRNHFITALQKEGIGCGIHFTALHLHKYYRQRYRYTPGAFPHAEYLGDNYISLPLSPAMAKSDVLDVIQAVIKLVKFYKK